ncbi:MAG: Crp/Fnr family transcriptional regulator [Treponema sp.]|nr:Crp/Fnr family transcriptional regulator [Treponema sp.]
MLNLYQSFLSKTAIFKGIPLSDIDKAIQCLGGYFKNFDSNQEVYPSGKQIQYAGILIEGQIHVQQLGLDGKELLLRQIKKGELFGAALCYLNTPNPFMRIVSAEKSKVLFLQMPDGSEKNRCNCPYRMIVLENILRGLAVEAQRLNMKIQLLIQPTLRDKILFYLEIMSKNLGQKSFVMPLTREKFAQYICADRSAVSRELGRMEADGLIVIEGKSITLL